MRFHPTFFAFATFVAAGCATESFDYRDADVDVNPDTGIEDAAPDVPTGCTSNTECEEVDASRCDTTTGECVTCQGNNDCSHLDNTVCDDGTCVECTADEEGPCEGNSCDPVANECTSTPTNNVGTCLPCLADSECTAGRKCIALEFPQGTPRGHYCMLERPSEGCTTAPMPWTVGLGNRTTRSGIASLSFCGINESLTTCEAVRAAVEDGAGVGCAVDNDSACPTGGLCAETEEGTRCTYLCGNSLQCPDESDDPDLAGCPGTDADPRCCGCSD
jgi:hypothetical protein